MTFGELCKLDDRLLALHQEAGAFRVLFEDGRTGRTFSADRAAKLQKDPNYCSGQLWHALPQDGGDVGIKFLANQVIDSNTALHEYRDFILAMLWDALPCCQHHIVEEIVIDGKQRPSITRGHKSDFPVPEPSPELAADVAAGRREILKRKRGPVGFGGLIAQLRNAALKAAGKQQVPIKRIDGREKLPDDLAEPVFIVDSTESSVRLRIDLNYRERLAAGEITRWYAFNSVFVCDSKTRKLLLSETLTKVSFVGALSWKPVVLTYKDDALERKLATICTQVVTMEPDKNGVFSLDKVHEVVKAIAPPLNLDVPDMPSEVLDGWLGEICRKHMSGFPIAYAWPALLTAASVLVPNLPNNVRTNLYVGLIGSVGTGKTSAFERAFWLLKVAKPLLENLKSGSGEGMAEYLGDLQGAKRLVFVNELAHLLAKVNYQGSTFEQFLNDAYYQNEQTLTIARGRQINFNCCMTLAGGLPEEKFEELFGLGTIGGFHDRATFGVCPTKIAPFAWQPLEGDSPLANELNRTSTSSDEESESIYEQSCFDERPKAITIDRDVWIEKNRWQKEFGIGGRAAEAGLRAAIIAATFDCRGTLRVEELGPALAFARYQEFVHKRYAPNPGKTNEGIAAHKMLSYLKQNVPPPNCEWMNRRKVILNTSCHDFGPGVALRALIGLESIGEIESSKSGRQTLVRLNPDRY